MARLARHARLDWLDKVERVESGRVEPIYLLIASQLVSIVEEASGDEVGIGKVILGLINLIHSVCHLVQFHK